MHCVTLPWLQRLPTWRYWVLVNVIRSAIVTHMQVTTDCTACMQQYSLSWILVLNYVYGRYWYRVGEGIMRFGKTTDVCINLFQENLATRVHNAPVSQSSMVMVSHHQYCHAHQQLPTPLSHSHVCLFTKHRSIKCWVSSFLVSSPVLLMSMWFVWMEQCADVSGATIVTLLASHSQPHNHTSESRQH